MKNNRSVITNRTIFHYTLFSLNVYFKSDHQTKILKLIVNRNDSLFELLFFISDKVHSIDACKYRANIESVIETMANIIRIIDKSRRNIQESVATLLQIHFLELRGGGGKPL